MSRQVLEVKAEVKGQYTLTVKSDGKVTWTPLSRSPVECKMPPAEFWVSLGELIKGMNQHISQLTERLQEAQMEICELDNRANDSRKKIVMVGDKKGMFTAGVVFGKNLREL